MQTLKRLKPRAVHVGELRGRIGLERDQHEALFNILESMAEEGLIVQMPGGRFRLRKRVRGDARPMPAPPEVKRPAKPSSIARSAEESAAAADSSKRRTGLLIVNGRGFGFVSPSEPGPDIFIPATGLGVAMHGDRVAVRVRPSAKGLEGRVLEVLQRGLEYVSGQVHVTASGALIEPDDDRIRYPIYLRSDTVPTTGQGVIAKVVRYPEHPGDRIEATLLESFDPREFVAFETRRILLREGVAEAFPEAALAEAQALPRSVPERDKRGRVDLRQLDLVTIDPDDARDHDDAVWAEPLKQGGFRVIVAIADVSHYVPEGSALDLDAQTRGCTIYLPTHAIPMLPPEISSNLASLVPNRDRLALAVETEIGPQGAVRRYRLLEAVVRSHARLSYAGVARALGLTETGPVQKAASSRLPLLNTLMEVAAVLGAKRRRRGSLEFDLPEAKVMLDGDSGLPLTVTRSRSDPGVRKAYNMIEELALLANEVVAADLTKRKLPTIYRIHAPPDEERVTAFAELANSLGYQLEIEDAQNPKRLSRFLAKVRKTEYGETLGYLLLRAMQQASYDIHNIGHFGLAAKAYVHFTSPIRRYPDLAIHRIVRQIARGERVRTHRLNDTLTEYSAASSKLERRAMSIEREVVDLYRAIIMQDRVGEVFDATITGLTDHGVFAAIDDPYVDVLCRLSALPRDQWESDAFGIRLKGLRSGQEFALGDRLRVQIEDVSVARRRISATPVDAKHALPHLAEAPPDGASPKTERDMRRQHSLERKRRGKTRDSRERDVKAQRKQRRREVRKERQNKRGNKQARRGQGS